jgi:Fur family transcriptional regulator, peroxide stress response regulator
MAKTDVFLNALRQAGYRVTEQRRRICEFLAQTDSHPTPYEVYAAIAQKYPEISRATVYNTLNVLRQLGVIVEIGMGADHTHYDTNPTPHINLVCLRCHKIVDFPASFPMESLAPILEQSGGFQPVTARVDVLGFCQECQARKRLEIQDAWRQQQT